MKVTLTESYVLVETDDIDFSLLRKAAKEVIIEGKVEKYDTIEPEYKNLK
jgi:hypothetical protein